MKILIKNAKYLEKEIDLLINDGKIAKIASSLNEEVDKIIDAKNLTIMPAFVDMHTHLREPGFEYKEDIESGCKAAVAGGYASVCCMPNTKPVIDNKYIVNYILNRAKDVNLAKVYPIGAITVGLQGEQMSEMGKLKKAGIVAVSDDGQPVSTAQMMRLALEYAKDFDLPVISHCEDKSLVENGVVNEGANSSKAGLNGIPRAAEEVMVSREIILAQMLDTKVHIAHVSTKGSVSLVRDAKKRGIKVTCETCPHYICGTDDLILSFNANTKVNPPLREEEDRLAIIEGIVDGTIDVIATDHAPHSKQEKEIEYQLAANGIVGLETAFSLCYSELVRKNKITLEKLSNLMTEAPAKIMNIEYGKIEEGAVADIVLIDLDKVYKIDAKSFKSKGKNTPFDGWEVYGQIKYTLVNGEIKYEA